MEIKEKQNQRIFLYDLLKVLAMFGVIMIHTSGIFVSDHANTTFSFQLGNIFNSITRCSVPIFLMVSGALILNEDKSFTMRKMFHSVKKTLCLLYSWSFIYTFLLYVIYPLMIHKGLDIQEILHSFVFGHYHLWYLFALIGVYLVTPILKLFIKKENMKYIEWYLLLSMIVVFILPMSNYLLYKYTGNKFLSDYAEMYDITIFNSYCCYYILGWYLRNKDLSKQQIKLIYVFGCIGFMITLFGAYLITARIEEGYLKFYNVKTINIFLYSAMIFTLVKQNQDKLIRFKSIIESISKLSFGVYGIHVLVLIVFCKVIKIANPFLSLIVIYTSTALLSILASYLIGKIPVLKKLTKF